MRWNALETKLGDGAGESARETGSVGDGREVAQLFGPLRGIYDASGNGFNPQAADGREVRRPMGCAARLGGELDERESVDALAAVAGNAVMASSWAAARVGARIRISD